MWLRTPAICRRTVKGLSSVLCNSMTWANNTMWDDEHLSAGYDSSNCIFCTKNKEEINKWKPVVLWHEHIGLLIFPAPVCFISLTTDFHQRRPEEWFIKIKHVWDVQIKIREAPIWVRAVRKLCLLNTLRSSWTNKGCDQDMNQAPSYPAGEGRQTEPRVGPV